jgi:hypothetical protein
MASVLQGGRAAVKTVVRHPNGVSVNGKLFLRDDYYASNRVSLREWLALGVLVLGLLMWAAVVVVGLIWLVRRWL